MDGEIEGTLVLVDTCLRVYNDQANTSHLLIWPPGFNLTNENDTIEILNSDGEIVAQIGDRVQMGGGEIHSKTMLEKSIQEQVPPQCTGPYLIFGDW